MLQQLDCVVLRVSWSTLHNSADSLALAFFLYGTYSAAAAAACRSVYWMRRDDDDDQLLAYRQHAASRMARVYCALQTDAPADMPGPCGDTAATRRVCASVVPTVALIR